MAGPDLRDRSWRLRVLILAGSAVVAALLAFFVAVHHRLGAGAPLLAFALVEAWRARSVYRRRPGGPYDPAVEQAARHRRMRTSAIIITVTTAAELITAGFANDAALWWLGGGLALGCVLVWATLLGLLPTASVDKGD